MKFIKSIFLGTKLYFGMYADVVNKLDLFIKDFDKNSKARTGDLNYLSSRINSLKAILKELYPQSIAIFISLVSLVIAIISILIAVLKR